jgi:glutamate-ammonia-ligase adenylyltransferase
MDSAQHLFDLSQEKIPLELRPAVDGAWRQFRDHLPRPALGEPQPWISQLPRVFAASEFAARLCAQHPSVLLELVESGDLARPYAEGEITRRVQRELDGVPDDTALKARLRHRRRREMLRIAWRDLAGVADLGEVVATLSELAEVCVDEALKKLHAWACAKYGEPRAEAGGAPQQLVVLGMGKLGGRELNFSSDIDLIFAYPEEGQTAGERSLSNHEFFVRLGQTLIAALHDQTADGFVFRVDMRLRPNGASGPLALCFDAMEHYYEIHGREWERYALIKARTFAGDRRAGAELLARLKPFVFRKYLDFGAIEGIRAMKAMIAREVERKAMQANVKLGPGGIREIEFIAQALQLIRGGREPQLQEPALLKVLPRLVAAGHLDALQETDLTQAYVFLRNAEHRIQMVEDRQTQLLPGDAKEQARLAFASGFENWITFEATLNRHRLRVQEIFSHLFAATPGAVQAAARDNFVAVWLQSVDSETAKKILVQGGYPEAETALMLLEGLRSGGAYESFSAEGRARMDRLVPLLLAETAHAPEPLTTLARIVNLLEAIGRRSTYLALLIENPTALAQLVKLCSASPWIASWIGRHPILLDELLDPRMLYAPISKESLTADLRGRLAHIPADDEELQLEILREFRHGHVLRVAAADLGPGLEPENVGARLAWIAESVIHESLDLAWRTLAERHGRPHCPQRDDEPGFAVIGYGKLGSVELGYASDLDIVFLYEGCEDGTTDGETAVVPSMARGPRLPDEVDGPEAEMPRSGLRLDSTTESRAMPQGRGGNGFNPSGARSLPNETVFARLGQRLIHVLTTRTAGGILYEVDMRLRPSGKSGPLVSTLDAFEHYQRTQAWTWEHQALVRARPVAGSARVREEFGRIRESILRQPRDPEKLKRDVYEMRARMADGHPGTPDPGQFNVKHDRGGIVDIEFMVQYWVLRRAAEHPGLTAHTDNIRILQALTTAGLLAAETAETLVGAYRRYLSLEHRTKLMERGSTVERAELGDFPERVRRVWEETIG